MNRVVGCKFTVELSVDAAVDPQVIADDLLDYLCDGGDGMVAYPEAIFSADSVEVRRG